LWNKKLLILNGLAISAVVLNHAAHRGFTSIFWWAHRFRPVESPNFDLVGSSSYWVLSIILQLTVFSVPAFIFISGFFVAYAAKGPNANYTWKMVRVRVLGLLIPYLIWSFVIFLFDYIQGIAYTPADYFKKLLTGDAVGAFFFVPLLVQLYFLSPLIVKLAKRKWKLLLFISILLQLIAQVLKYKRFLIPYLPYMAKIPSPNWFFGNMIFFFVTGLIVGLNLKKTKNLLSKIKWHLLFITLFSLLLAIFEYHYFAIDSNGIWVGDFRSFPNNIYSTSLIACFMGFNLISIPKISTLIKIGKRSYGIYLMHQPILGLLSRLIYHTTPNLFAYQIFFILLLVLVGLGLPYLAMDLVSRSSVRQYYKYLFG
jgi:surface polysaccharide O-acyltransferase-like enzyme